MSEKQRLLLVEDDPSFGSVLKDYLLINDFDVTHAIDGEDGLNKFKEGEYDLCILDVMMPKKDGFTLGKEIKQLKPEQPIIFLTAKNMRDDVLNGYKIGADDYVLKPFDSEVLLYKIKAVLQRNFGEEEKFEQEEFTIGKFHFNAKLRQLVYEGKSQKLSPKENELLRLLAIYKNDLMPREIALTRIWHDDNYFTSRSMDVYIAKLRKYLKKDPNVEIVNIHGEGFRLLIQEI
ncbi:MULTISPECIES: response regulator transcription factor [Weeksella]|uniref:Two component transcriptional regulator, winged helix family n=1 Tax=Weeksella virosa (strain ATCC 43766 / DSM 16922 / JCM 21250 / CCUG 30538 / CDC 9751 / IAM 14551 / NBRC 16016 / NCTC 11634 / CL345/78) TaxID=865938 RepID=F0P046_WEEVC|nr:MULTISPECIES: response regulator transcription factor [Weeksella]ADX67393.1 two component transcriptional regulator, winged helix family [Weeksella virosa DSM 16922]MDK7374379.1 response regulator transcription factor [Weeksella virosa]MDK7675674.1 response regulator transcription factor [Weeksella virosa]OFM81967.1 two-component system response regulator [Weeksella sp. HMSC059D05]SUP53684.1 Response regulator ArlR [Weeksella virosa]